VFRYRCHLDHQTYLESPTFCFRRWLYSAMHSRYLNMYSSKQSRVSHYLLQSHGARVYVYIPNSNGPMQRVSRPTKWKKLKKPVCSDSSTKPPNENANQHLAFTFQPLSLTLAASTSAAPIRADVDAQVCGAMYLPPSAACRAPPIGLRLMLAFGLQCSKA
jgi:hypothetical protein